jgi:4-amino-4-deoxy-L-arabinose transferase-like glycosyltransferase
MSDISPRDRGGAHESSPPKDTINCASPSESNADPAFGCGKDARIWTLGLFVVLAFLAASFAHTLTAPWVEEDTWYGAVYSQAAHNNLRVGILANGGVPATLYFGPLPIPRDAYYVHHPTLFPLLVTVAFKIFGEAEWVARLVPVLCSLASVVFLWLLVKSAAGRRAATFSAAIFATLPMELHYGDLVDFEPCLLMWMLAALLGLRYWWVSNRRRWAVLSMACCQLALWTDWPGYLFVLSMAGGLVVLSYRKGAAAARPAAHLARRLGLALIGLVGCSGLFFLWQIHHVNPDAWADLWNALLMRLDNHVAIAVGASAEHAARFTFVEWCWAVLHGLHEDFLAPPWLLAALGIACLVRGWKHSEGLRWCSLVASPMIFAGVVYVVVLRNESFIHDFAPFYLIGALALLAGVGLDHLMGIVEQRLPSRAWRSAAGMGSCALFVALATAGYSRAESERSPFRLLDGQTSEPPDLAPVLGRYVGRVFPEGTDVLCNFDPYGSTLDYYAQRTILTNLSEPAHWQAVIAQEQQPLGGIVWMGAPQAEAIVSALPAGKITPVVVDGVRFVTWRATPAL